MALLGLFGYIYRRCFLNIILWKIIFFIQVIALVYSSYILLTGFSQSNLSQLDIALMLFFTLLLMGPEVLALYLYSYKSKELWSN